MPGLDKTGPEGKGSKTGRGLGTCGSKTSIDESKEEQNSQNLEKKLSRKDSIGKKRCRTWKQVQAQRRSGKIIQ